MHSDQSLCPNQACKVLVGAARSQHCAGRPHIHTTWGCRKPRLEEETRGDNGVHSSAKLPLGGRPSPRWWGM